MLPLKKVTSSDWQSASERLNRYVSQDRNLGMQLANLSKQQSKNDKIAFKLESSRIYGLRRQDYDFILERQLESDMKKPPVESHW
jgi:division protein CdvB (Snf7/Vps24/ESCRT-III family)